MTSVDWITISAIGSITALLMGGFLWFANKIFNLGRTSQRLDSIETELKEFKQEANSQFKAVRQEITAVGARIDQRIDKLIVTIAQSNQR